MQEKIIVVGATGLVGQTIIQVMEERGMVTSHQLIAAASERSVGKNITWGSSTLSVVSIEDAMLSGARVALFAAGGDVSKQWARAFMEKGIVVIDNSSAFRMESNVPLIIPEINAEEITQHQGLISNPNCSTIQLLMAIAPLHRAWQLQSMHIATYQSVSGSGMKGINQLQQERQGEKPQKPAYPHPIDLNCIPHCDDFLNNGYTKEEMKLTQESQKILHLPQLPVSATAVRVPVWGGHSEAVSAHFTQSVDPKEAQKILSQAPGIEVVDNPQQALYPMARHAQGKDAVFVGRIRRDLTHPQHALLLWIVADNLRKGAATNAVQIAQWIYNHKAFI